MQRSDEARRLDKLYERLIDKRTKNLKAENKTLKDMLRKEGYEFFDFSEIKVLNPK